MKGFRSYSVGEYISAALRTLLTSTHFTQKALSHLPPHSSAEWSCRAEAWPWRQLALSCSPLLSLVNFGQKLTAVYFLNRIPESKIISGLSLFERRFSTLPDYQEFRVYRFTLWWKPPQLRLEPGVQPFLQTRLSFKYKYLTESVSNKLGFHRLIK